MKLREDAGRRLSTEHTASFVDMAFARATTMESAINRFRNSGFWPANCVVFTDDDLALSVVTDQH
jgi:hypothetical protein